MNKLADIMMSTVLDICKIALGIAFGLKVAQELGALP